MKKSVSKWIALLLSVAMIVMCAAGCSQAQTQEPSTDNAAETPAQAADTPAQAAEPEQAEPVTITFWHTYGDSEEAQFLNVVMPLWESLHPEITVEAVRQDSSQYHQMIVTSFGTGMSPDVARVDIANIAAYAKQGGLAALSDYPDFAELSASYLDAPLSTNLYQGKYYGLPLDTNCKAAVVNTNVLRELGLDEIPATMEEFIEAAKTRGTYSLNVSGVGDWDMYPYFWLFGGEDIAVFATSAHPEAAYEFARFMTSEDVQLAMLEAGQLPILKSLVSSDAVQSNPVWSVYMQQMESAKARIPSPNNSAIQEIWSETVTSIFVDGADVAQALHDAAARIDEQLS